MAVFTGGGAVAGAGAGTGAGGCWGLTVAATAAAAGTAVPVVTSSSVSLSLSSDDESSPSSIDSMLPAILAVFAFFREESCDCVEQETPPLSQGSTGKDSNRQTRCYDRMLIDMTGVSHYFLGDGPEWTLFRRYISVVMSGFSSSMQKGSARFFAGKTRGLPTFQSHTTSFFPQQQSCSRLPPPTFHVPAAARCFISVTPSP